MLEKSRKKCSENVFFLCVFCYNATMNKSEKLCADIRRIAKHERMEHSGNYNGIRVCEQAAAAFRNSISGLGDLPASIAAYWLETYIYPASCPDDLPDTARIDWLSSALELLDGDDSSAGCFTSDDWVAFRDMVNAEAEELPLPVLSSLMGMIMNHGAL